MAFFRFFDLPGEIRTLVYAECARSIPLKLDRNFRPGTGKWTFTMKEISCDNPAGILTASSQLRKEMWEYLVSYNVLYIDDLETLRHTEAGMKRYVPFEIRQRLQHVEVEMGVCGSFWAESDPSQENSVMIDALTAAFPRLQNVTIRSCDMGTDADPPIPYDLEREAQDQFVKFWVRKQYSMIKDVFNYCQSKGIALRMRLVYHGDDCHPVDTDWTLDLLQAPESKEDLIVQRRDPALRLSDEPE